MTILVTSAIDDFFGWLYYGWKLQGMSCVQSKKFFQLVPFTQHRETVFTNAEGV
jgi:hypothetical protein